MRRLICRITKRHAWVLYWPASTGYDVMVCRRCDEVGYRDA